MKLEMQTSARTNKKILVVCIVAFLALMILGVVKNYQTRDYVKIDGRITHFSKLVDSGIEDKSQNTVIKYVHCEYIVDKKIYTAKYRTFLSSFLKENGDITIAYDAENPQNTRNRFENEVLALGKVFLLLFIFFLGYSLKQEKDESNFDG